MGALGAGNLVGEGLAIGPDRAIFEMLLLPDRHGAFERIDEPAAGVESSGPVGRSHHDQHTGFADFKPSQTMDYGNIANLELSQRWGLATLSPGVSYSKESDYESVGVSLNLALDFNQKLLGLMETKET